MKYVSHRYRVSSLHPATSDSPAGFLLIGARNIHSTHTGGVHIHVPEGFCDESI
jgi:hypothetical protein